MDGISSRLLQVTAPEQCSSGAKALGGPCKCAVWLGSIAN